jgi:hypothetical protein
MTMTESTETPDELDRDDIGQGDDEGLPEPDGE